MNSLSPNDLYAFAMLVVTLLLVILATLLDSYIVSAEYRVILFFSLVAISMVSYHLIREYTKQREFTNTERNRQQMKQRIKEIPENSLIQKKFQDFFEKTMEDLVAMKSPPIVNIDMSHNTVTTTNSPGASTILGNSNTSTIGNIVGNIIQQLPDSNPNKSVLRQLQEEIEKNRDLSDQDKEYALNQIKVLAELPTSRLTPTQRHIASHARDFFIGFAAGMCANLVSKFVIPA